MDICIRKMQESFIPRLKFVGFLIQEIVKMPNLACFADFNGVIAYNDCHGKQYPFYILRPEQFILIDGASEAHKLLYENDFYMFWITHQGSITERLITRGRLTNMFNAIASLFRQWNDGDDLVTEIAIVTNDIVGDDSDPKIQQLKADVKVNAMLKLKDRYDIDMDKSLGVGDRTSDIDGFERAGIGSKYQILTPFGDKATVKADSYFESLIDCVKFHIG